MGAPRRWRLVVISGDGSFAFGSVLGLCTGGCSFPLRLFQEEGQKMGVEDESIVLVKHHMLLLKLHTFFSFVEGLS